MKAISLLAILFTLTTQAHASCQQMSFQLERQSGFSSLCEKVLPEGEYHFNICNAGLSGSVADPNGKVRALNLEEGRMLSVVPQKEVFSVDMKVTEVQMLHFRSPGNAIVCRGYFYR